MRIPVILAISLAAVLAGSLLLVGPFSVSSIVIPKPNDAQQAEATALPLVIRDRFAEKQMAGDAEAGSRFLKVNEDFVDPENHCEFCTRVEYTPGPEGMAGFSYEDAMGLDLSSARKVRFWVMGEEGDEKIKFKLAGKSLDKIQDRLGKLSSKLTKSIFKTESFALTTEQVTLDDKWKKYEVDLSGVDLRGITHPFAFELAENDGQKQVLYIKGVVYDDEPAEDPLTATAEELIEPLSVEITSNATEGTAPATFEFEANVTGGTEPYSMTWDFDDDSEEDEGQNVVHTFEEAGEYNVTLLASDAGGQNASDSVVIQVEEPEIVEEEEAEEGEVVDNSTLTDTNSTNAQEEETTNSTDSVGQQPTDESAEIQANAGIDVVAQPGDTIVLSGEITGVDTEIEGLELSWRQTSGSSVEISGAESLNPRIAISDLEDDAEIQLEFTANLGSDEDSDSVMVFVEQVGEIEGAQVESLDPAESEVAEWVDKCDDLADCMSDNSPDTFASASPEDAENVNLFSFEEFDVENAEIEYVTAVATARTGETGYLLFTGANAENAEDQSEPPGAVSITSNSDQEYEYIWEENPTTDGPWTAESLNSFLAGYAYGDGESDIEVSEFNLIVTYTVEPPQVEAESDEDEAEENQAEQTSEQSNAADTNSTSSE